MARRSMRGEGTTTEREWRGRSESKNKSFTVKPREAQTSAMVHPAQQCSNMPSSPSFIDSEGFLSLCDGHSAIHPREVFLTLPNLARTSSTVIVPPASES